MIQFVVICSISIRVGIVVVPDFTILEPDSGFGEKLFLDHRTIRLMKLMASTMLSMISEKRLDFGFAGTRAEIRYMPNINLLFCLFLQHFCSASVSFISVLRLPYVQSPHHTSVWIKETFKKLFLSSANLG